MGHELLLVEDDKDNHGEEDVEQQNLCEERAGNFLLIRQKCVTITNEPSRIH